VDKFCTSVYAGNNNLKTLNMNEDGLAKALFNDVGTNTGFVQEVFERLDEHHNSDADDVPEHYVNMVRSPSGTAVQQALRQNRDLIQLLITVMDEGWTTGGEEGCIKFLRTL
jgi:hypothetical protein